MRKFYKKAEAGTAPGGFVIRLDGRVLKTPLQKNMLLPSLDLAQAVADEWSAQGADINLESMPVNKLINTMIDKAEGPDREAMAEDVMRYACSDLICYFAASPRDLVERQESAWLPLLSWLDQSEGIRLEHVAGIQYHHQPADSIALFQKKIAGMSPWEFTVMQAVTGICGSAVIAFAFLRRHIDVATAYNAACVDEIYQLDKWGEDAQARNRLDRIKADLDSVATFMKFF